MISACIIAKDEAHNITDCINSLKDAVDEVIVMDTGSSDQTIQYARKLGAKVFSYKWDNNFSAARNACLDKASGDWIFVIDCDERLTPTSASLLKTLQHTPGVTGFGITIVNIINAVPSYTCASMRFFRNLPTLRYTGIIHEQIGSLEQQKEESLIFLKSDIELIHYGYETDPLLEAKKSKRNLYLLDKVPTSERDGMYYLHLGAEYTRLGDCKAAAETFTKGYSLANKSHPYFLQLAQKTVDALYANAEYEKCLDYCSDILKDYIDFKSIYFTQSACYGCLKHYQQALNALRIYRHLKNSPYKYPLVNYDAANDIDGMIKILEHLVTVQKKED